MKTPVKILMLEDSVSDAELIQRIILKAGIVFESKVVDNKKAYLCELHDFFPDIILSDHTMPRFNSIDALRALKQFNIYIPFILITGSVSEEFAVQIMQEGADDYLLKSNLLKLPAAIENAIKQKQIEKEKAKYEQRLKETNVFLSQLLETQPIILYTCKTEDEYRYNYISSNSEKYTGYALKDFVMNPKFWEERIHPDDVSSVFAHIESAWKTGACSMEYRWMISNGTYRWFYDSFNLLKNPNQHPSIVGAWIDITERKKTEEQLQYRIRELDTLIYRSSHDLRGPLASMIGLTDIAMNEIKDDVALNFIELIQQSAKRLDEILINLVKVVKIAQGHIELSIVDFEQMVNTILKNLENLPNYKGLTVKSDIQKNDKFLCDAFLLSSVMQNIIENAIKYRKTKDKNAFIDISVKFKDNNCLIKIKDNGQGIPAEQQSRIFDMFYRATESSSGSGLGLYIVKNIIEKLKGMIELQSKLGKGTTFLITLPQSVSSTS